ncbi:antitoxin [Actinoallomurus sp. NPDC052274]|uniref:antitoxin n=1 Tax=Actinoallomurus sp. NPDC052274 TaxID=3155420 RepID=UPI003448573A
MSFMDKVKNLLGQHGDKVDEAIEKAGDMADRKTGGKYSRQIDTAQEQAHRYVERSGGQPHTPEEREGGADPMGGRPS